jgi:very-short-patch-repair endonuclease
MREGVYTSREVVSPSPFTGEGGARSRSEREGEGQLPTRKELLTRARWMRAHPTEAEKRLWCMLRDRRLAAFKFKRQQIILPYIVDLVCFTQRLIIEADGSQHADNRNDSRRDTYLRAQGFRLLRFWNNEVLGDSETVATAIIAALSPSPSQAFGLGPSLSRKGRGAAGAPDG